LPEVNILNIVKHPDIRGFCNNALYMNDVLLNYLLTKIDNTQYHGVLKIVKL